MYFLDMLYGCLKALDGTFIEVRALRTEKNHYLLRKGLTFANVLDLCNRDMNYVCIIYGWEGSATNNQVLRGTLNRPRSLQVPTFPSSGILMKYIKSKLHVLKNTNSYSLGILGSGRGAGASMDLTMNMIITEMDAVWEDYIKVHPKVSKLKGKAQPWYDSWAEIFSNDRT